MLKTPQIKDDKFKRVKVRNFLKQLSLEGFDRNKFFLTIKNLKFANENIKFYTKKNLERKCNYFTKKTKCCSKRKFFFSIRMKLYLDLLLR